MAFLNLKFVYQTNNFVYIYFRSVNWTSQTATAIQESTLMQRKTKQSHELSQIVELVKNGLTPAVRNTGGFHLYLFYSSSSNSSRVDVEPNLSLSQNKPYNTC